MLNFSDAALAALERVRATIADQERSLLSAEACKQVLAVLDNPPEPTEALREAMKLHKARTRDGACRRRTTAR